MNDASVLRSEVDALVAGRYAELVARCRGAGITLHDDAGVAERIRRTLLASDYAYEIWSRHPELLAAPELSRWRDSADAEARRSALNLPHDEAGAMAALRRFRHAEALRLIFRDVNELDALSDTLSSTSVLYEVLLDAALQWSQDWLAERYGHARDEEGRVQHLIVLGFGKLGGSELNFSSDIDLVLAFAESGQSDGARELDNGEYFTRLTRQLVRLLAEPTADGIVARVDLRLRPFGNVGRLALPFAAMEQYYQQEGRDWERYAWIKARPVAGDRAAGRRLLDLLRPFVYRRYLDYTAFAGLRDMKALIDAEVARKDLSENLKLGSGGIREIEFIVQLVQLIRGGRDPALRVRGLMPALAACESRGFIPAERAKRLREAYRFLRRLENRVQMLRDAQTHDVPSDALARERLALGLGYPAWDAVANELQRHREVVAEEFAEMLVPHGGRHAEAPPQEAEIWRAAGDDTLEPSALRAAGFEPADAVAAALMQLPRAASVRGMSVRGSERLQRLMPQLIAEARQTPAPGACLMRLARLVQSVARRSAYLALLEEQPAARRRLAALFADTAFLAESVIDHPLLLDDVLDPRIDQLPLRRADIAAELTRALAMVEEDDPEARLDRLNELKASMAFRLGLAFRDNRADAVATSRRLAALAAAVLGALLSLAERELVAQHGRLPGHGSGFAVLGYGSLGGEELGFASDLDLVFVYDGERALVESDGERPLDGVRWYQRLAQRVIHWVSALTRGGRLYEIDTRLRPDGSKGLLVTSLDAFEAYQLGRAWTWEHQALLRARPVAGDPALGERLRSVRRLVLMQPRAAEHVRTEVVTMRRRWRSERDRTDALHFDLKQGAGGLLDIEFILQGLVLMHAATQPQLLSATSNADLIEACHQAGLLSPEQAERLAEAHGTLLARALDCTLDRRPRLAPLDARLEALRATVLELAGQLGFDFIAAADPE